MNPGTFGSSKCAVNLAAMLTEINESALTRRVSNFLTNRNRLAKALLYIPADGARSHFAQMMVNEIRDHVFCEGTPLRVATHAKNVATGNVRRIVFDGLLEEPCGYPMDVTPETEFDD